MELFKYLQSPSRLRVLPINQQIGFLEINTQKKGRPGRVKQTLIINTKIFLNRVMEGAEKKVVIFRYRRNMGIRQWAAPTRRTETFVSVSAWKWRPADIQPSGNHTRQQDTTNHETRNSVGEGSIPTRSVMQLFCTNSAEKHSVVLIKN